MKNLIYKLENHVVLARLFNRQELLTLPCAKILRWAGSILSKDENTLRTILPFLLLLSCHA
jgi:hypothetical protein